VLKSAGMGGDGTKISSPCTPLLYSTFLAVFEFRIFCHQSHILAVGRYGFVMFVIWQFLFLKVINNIPNTVLLFFGAAV